jgi:hypothetical protein
MLLSDQLKEMREQKGIPQRIVAAKLDIDTATYCKMEKGALKPKRSHIPLLASLFEVNEEQLLKDWLAEKITSLAMTEAQVAVEALEIAYKGIKRQ